MNGNLRIRSFEIPVDLPDLSELEKSALIRAVEERFDEVERMTGKKVVDTTRLALLTAVTFADELLRLQDLTQNQRLKDEHRLDQVIDELRRAVK